MQDEELDVNDFKNKCICVCHTTGMKTISTVNPPIPCCACSSFKLTTGHIGGAGYSMPIVMPLEKFTYSDSLDLLKRIKIIEDFIGQNYQKDSDNLTHLIDHAQSGIEKCFEKIESLEHRIDLAFKGYDSLCKELFERVEKLEKHEQSHVISWGRLTDEFKSLTMDYHGSIAAINKNTKDSVSKVVEIEQMVKELQRFQDITHLQYQKNIGHAKKETKTYYVNLYKDPDKRGFIKTGYRTWDTLEEATQMIDFQVGEYIKTVEFEV